MSTVADIMTLNPACCTPQMTVQEAARMMREFNCGIIPVIEDESTRHLVGVLTDRDIVLRVVADGHSPAERRVGECLTGHPHTLPREASLEECRGLMQGRKVRRVPVVDASRAVVGIVSMADLPGEVEDEQIGITLAEISEPDARQLYSQVNEDNHPAGTVSDMDDPLIQHPLTGT